MIWIKNLLFTLLMPGSLVVWIPWLLLRAWHPGPRGWHHLGWIPITFGASLYLSCVWRFGAEGKGTPAPIDPPTEMVARGPYRRVRNPMYIGLIALLAGESLLFGSTLLLAYAGGALLVFQLFVRLYEEPALRRKFGTDYDHYCAEVPRWLPRIR